MSGSREFAFKALCKEQVSSSRMSTIIRIRCIFCTTIQPNMNMLFGLIFGPSN